MPIRPARCIAEDDRGTSTRSNPASRRPLPAAVDPLTATVREVKPQVPEARGSRIRGIAAVSQSRRLTFEETADTTPFELIDPENPAATQRDMRAPICRHRMQVALVASAVLAIAGYITIAV